jgi:hypothetical protein
LERNPPCASGRSGRYHLAEVGGTLGRVAAVTLRRCWHRVCPSRNWPSTWVTPDPGFTLRTYTHLVPSSFERARLAIDGVFGLKSADGLKAA